MEIRLLAKLIERLHDLGRSDPAPMGFIRPVERKRKPALLVIGEASPRQIKSLVSNGAIEHLDAVLVTGAPSGEDAKSLGDVLWGARVSRVNEKGLDELKESGCDFILVESEDAPAAVVRDDGMARGKELPLDVTERQARVLEDLPFDFLTLKYNVKPEKLTLAGLLEFQAAVSMVGKHIVLEVGELPSESELSLLRDLPIDAVIVPADGLTAKQGKSIRDAIDAIEPRKPRRHHDEPAIAQSGTPIVDSDGHDDGFDDDDDDDDDDFDGRSGRFEFLGRQLT
jgi:hypothetical protein